MNRSTTSKIQANRRDLTAGETMHGTGSAGKAMPGQGDWLTGSGIIDRMLAYRDWWNLPAGRAPGGNRETR